MITVSDEWKKIHQRPLLPESFVEITLGIEDPVKDSRRWPSDCDQTFFSQDDKIIQLQNLLSPMFYTTLEENLWSLDGSRRILTETNPGNNTGWVSYDDTLFKGDQYRGFEVAWYYAIETKSELGLDIVWSSEYNEYPVTFRIEAWGDDTLIDTKTVTGNDSIYSHVDYDFIGHKKLRIIPMDWNMPNRRFRIDQIYFGRIVTFDKNQILDYTHEQTGDALGAELSKNEITFRLDNHDRKWDLLNQEGLTRHLSEQQKLVVRYGLQTDFGIEWIIGGHFYLTEWRTTDNNKAFSMVARDSLGFMSEMKDSRKTSLAWADTVRPDTEMGTFGPTDVWDDDRGAPYYFTSLDALYRAKATGVRPDPDSGDFIYYEIEVGWGNDFRYDGAGEYEPETPINGLRKIYVYKLPGWGEYDNYYIDGDIVREINEGYASRRESVYEYMASDTSPAERFYATEITKSRSLPVQIGQKTHAEITQLVSNLCGCCTFQRANGAEYTMKYWETITDYVIPQSLSYVEPEVELAKPLKNVVVYYSHELGVDPYVYELAVGDSGETIIINNTGVDRLEWAEYLAEQYAEFYKERTWVSGEFRADPRLELFDIVKVEGKNGMIGWVLITQIKYSYNGSFHGTYKGKLLTDEFIASVTAKGGVT